MRTVANDIYIQRGETWSLDLDIRNERGEPYMLFREWVNPHLAITVSAARYEQPGDFRCTYWLDLDRCWVEQPDGSYTEQATKRFTETQAYPLSTFSAQDAVDTYGDENGGRIVFDKTSAYDVTNFLFFVDQNSDGVCAYKYLKSYELDEKGEVVGEEWEDYSFHIVKTFTTRDWIEQSYLYDVKILAGERVQERAKRVLAQENVQTEPLPWAVDYALRQISRIVDENERTAIMDAYVKGMPLMPEYDAKYVVLEQRKIFVSADLQGG